MKAILAILLALVCSPALADYWTWTEPAAHHAAVVLIRCGPYAGCGTLCKEDGTVLTANHVIETGHPIYCIWQNGYKSQARVIKTTPTDQQDIAFLATTPPEGAVVIPLVPADQVPQAGDALEYIGYGGPSQHLRHFSGKIIDASPDRIRGSAYLLSGDSGGAVVWNGYLVGAISGGNTATPAEPFEDGVAWPLHYPALSGRVVATATQAQCPGGRCEPQYNHGWQLQFGRQGRQQSAPPRQSPPQQAAPQQSAPRPTAPQQSAPDYSAELKQLNEDMKAIMARMDAQPACEAGADGKPGPPGPPGKDATIDLDALAEKLASKVGCKCDQKPAPEATPAVKHVVIVADQKANTWGRLRGEIDNAKSSYSGIKVVPPPSYPVGPLPQAVVYEGSTVIKAYRGSRQVSDLLSSIYRGDFQ